MSPSLVRGGALAVVLATLALTALVASDVRRSVGRPTPGFPVFANGVVSLPMLAPVAAPPAVRALRPHDRVVAVDGRALHGAADAWRAADEAGVGATLRWTFARPGGAPFDLALPVVPFSDADVERLYLPSLVIGLLLLGVGAIPVLVRPDLATSRIAFVFMTGASAGFFLLVLDYFLGQRFTVWLRLPGMLAMAALIHLGLVFPERRGPLARGDRTPALILYGGAALLWAVHGILFARAPRWTMPIDLLELGGYATGFLLLMANLIRTARHSPDAVRRRQAWVVLPSPLLAAVGMLVLFASNWDLVPVRSPFAVYLFPVMLVGLSLAYATLKHNVFEIDDVVRRALTLAIQGLAPVAAYLALFSVALPWLGGDTTWVAAAGAVLLLVVLVPAVALLPARVERIVENTLYPRRRAARAVVHAASRELPRARDEATVVAVLRAAVRDGVDAAGLRVVAGGADEPLRERGAVEGEPLVLTPADPLSVALRRGQLVQPAGGRTTQKPAPSRAAIHRASELGIALAVPLPMGAGQSGALLLGPRRDGRLYTSDDHLQIETLAGQAATALENGRAWLEIQALERRLRAENLYLRQEAQPAPDAGAIVGASPAIGAVLAQVTRVAPTDATVLVEGETGTGKELVVRALHAQSRRAERTLVRIACAAIPETLLESELFGHEAGAFTGAVGRKIGRFEIADGGTLFLDDVDTMPLVVQAKLLRALQEGEVQRLGGTTVRRVDVRVVAATNRDLLAEVRAGRFREDVYYRLNVVAIRLPPLRERREDIPLLVEHFVRRDGARLRRDVHAVAAEAMTALAAHDWPGNIRELRNVVQRALVLCDGDVLRLPGTLAPVAGAGPGGHDLGRASLTELLQRYKARLVGAAMRRAGGNQRVAAELLGIHRPSLTRMLRELEAAGD